MIRSIPLFQWVFKLRITVYLVLYCDQRRPKKEITDKGGAYIGMDGLRRRLSSICVRFVHLHLLFGKKFSSRVPLNGVSGARFMRQSRWCPAIERESFTKGRPLSPLNLATSHICLRILLMHSVPSSPTNRDFVLVYVFTIVVLIEARASSFAKAICNMPFQRIIPKK